MLKKLKWTRIYTHSSNDITPSQQVVRGDNKQALTIVFATESTVSDEIFFSKSSLKKCALNDDYLCQLSLNTTSISRHLSALITGQDARKSCEEAFNL